MSEEKRGPGNPPGENHRTSAEDRRQRQVDVVDLVAKGKSKAEIQKALDISEMTLWRTLKELDMQTVEVLPQTVEMYQAFRERERLRLEMQRDQVLESVSIRPRDRHVLLLQIHDRLAALLNLGDERFQPKEGVAGDGSVTFNWNSAPAAEGPGVVVVPPIEEEPKR